MNNDVYEGLNSDVLRLALDQAVRNIEHLSKIIEGLRQRAGNLLLIIIAIGSLIAWIINQNDLSQLSFNHVSLWLVAIPLIISLVLYGIAVHYILQILKPTDLPVPSLPPEWFGQEYRLFQKIDETAMQLLNGLQEQYIFGTSALKKIESKLTKAYNIIVFGTIFVLLASIGVIGQKHLLTHQYHDYGHTTIVLHESSYAPLECLKKDCDTVFVVL
jgi:hypothetical protein